MKINFIIFIAIYRKLKLILKQCHILLTNIMNIKIKLNQTNFRSLEK